MFISAFFVSNLFNTEILINYRLLYYTARIHKWKVFIAMMKLCKLTAITF
jgi:hypothetical protein